MRLGPVSRISKRLVGSFGPAALPVLEHLLTTEVHICIDLALIDLRESFLRAEVVENLSDIERLVTKMVWVSSAIGNAAEGPARS